MLDVDWVDAPTAFNGLMIYRYRSGMLRSRVIKGLEAVASKSGRVLSRVDPGELSASWNATSLFDGMQLFELSRPRDYIEFRALARVTPAKPTAVFFKFNVLPTDVGISADLVVEEPAVDLSNLTAILKYFEHHTDLGLTAPLTGQIKFESYFQRWSADAGEVALPALQLEFDRSVVLFVDVDTGEFQPNDDVEYEVSAPSYLVRALRRWLSSNDVFESANLLRVLSNRLHRGWSTQRLLADLVDATRRILAGPGGSGSRASAEIIHEATADVLPNQGGLILWALLLLLFEGRTQAPITRDDSEFLMDFDRHCRDYRQRTSSLAGDPLSGKWLDVVALLREHSQAYDEPLTARAALLSDLIKGEDGSHHPDWWVKCLRIAVSGPVQVAHQAEAAISGRRLSDPFSPRRFAEVIGHSRLVDELRRRVLTEGYTSPIALIGPSGVGKRTLARLYAKALMCEDRSAGDADPCCECDTCIGFDRQTTFGFIELDMSRAEAAAHVHQQMSNLSVWPLSKVRVILIADPEGVGGALDPMLKAFESGRHRTAFVVVGRDERVIRSALISRSRFFKLRPLSELDALKFIDRRLHLLGVPDQVVEFITMLGQGMPSVLAAACERIRKNPTCTLMEAKSAFGADWIYRALEYWQVLLGEDGPILERVRSFDGVNANEALRQIRYVLCHLGDEYPPDTIPLLGLDLELAQLRKLFSDRCARSGISKANLWNDLARLWASDDAVDDKSIAFAGLRARAIVRAPHPDKYANS